MTRDDQPLPRARLRDVLLGRAPLVGARFSAGAVRGLVSPVEARATMGIPYGDLEAEERAYLEGPSRGARADAAVVARAAVAGLLAPPRGARLEARPAIVSAEVDNVTIDDAVAAIVRGTEAERATFTFFVHPHALNLAAFDASFAGLLSRADHVLPDGIGVRLAAALLGLRLRHNLNGTDLLPLLCAAASDEGLPLCLVGAAPGVAAECAENLRRAHPELSIPIVSHGFLDAEASRALAADLGSLAPAIVLVGMGSPRQERWAHAHLADRDGLSVVTVGGLFDFYSGRVPRAPVAARELGLEWAYRLAQEPRRMARRYLLGNPLFLGLAAAQRAGLRKPPRRR